jgi:hypothetical protein
VKPIVQQFTTTNNFSASSTVQTKFGALNYWPTAMILDYEMNYSTGTSPAFSQDWLWRGITSLQLIGGGRPYLSLGNPDLRTFYWHNRLRLLGANRMQDPRNAASQNNLKYKVALVFNFGIHPRLANGRPNLWDTSAAIAPDPDLALNVTWGAAGSTTTNSVWGTNVGVNSQTLLRITLFGVTLDPGEPQPKFYPTWRTSQWAPTQTYAGKSGVVNLDPGYIYRRSTIMVLNGSTSAPPADERTNGMNSNAVSEIGLKTADGRYPIDQKWWDFVQRSQIGFQVADDNTASSDAGGLGVTETTAASSVVAPWNPGVGMVDYVEHVDPNDPSIPPAMKPYGIDMRSKSLGALAYAFTVDASTNTTVNFMHECYQQY